MRLITFATIEEAESTLNNFNAKNIKAGLYTSDIGLLAITGIGSFAAYMYLKQMNQPYSLIVNIGIAGSLESALESGSIHPIKNLYKPLWHPKGTYFSPLFQEINTGTDGLRLATLDFPLYSIKAELAPQADLVDMEGYAIALFATQEGKECQVYKLVSDHCSEDSSLIIKNNIREYSRSIATFLHNNFK